MAGYSGTPLIRKLGLKDGMRVAFLYAPEHYRALLGPLPETVLLDAENRVDFTHAFFTERTDFELDLPEIISTMARNGMVWISWPKKASKVPTSMSEDVVRAVALPLGLVDVKVCAVDEVWSGLKLVIRKELR